MCNNKIQYSFCAELIDAKAFLQKEPRAILVSTCCPLNQLVLPRTFPIPHSSLLPRPSPAPLAVAPSSRSQPPADAVPLAAAPSSRSQPPPMLCLHPCPHVACCRSSGGEKGPKCEIRWRGSSIRWR
ncbi:hypothetical protein BRADI_3g44602v3 [Brachypodium distachyon]|uniref:Uncharacterized protein n=1 Tax=Brachypodium distachyon TaxID=15368 RepID=A0A0Q3FK92_BRADI|nr:hypothetical protein BRADI_3g44602v3 [Brachypodium distachyon]